MTSKSVLGCQDDELQVAASDERMEAGHSFRAWACRADSLQRVRDGLDRILQDAAGSTATHLPYAFRLAANQGTENFDSDTDYNAGLLILKALRHKDANNIAVFVAHSYSDVKPVLSARAKTECINHVVAGALLALNNG